MIDRLQQHIVTHLTTSISKKMNVCFQTPDADVLRKQGPAINFFLIRVEKDSTRKVMKRSTVSQSQNGSPVEFLVSPPLHLNVVYQATAWAKTELDRSVLLIQLLKAFQNTNELEIASTEGDGLGFTSIVKQLDTISLEEQVQLWQALKEPFMPALYFQFSAELAGEREERPLKRVKQRSIHMARK